MGPAERLYKDQDSTALLTSRALAKSLTKSISVLAVYRLHGIIMAKNKKVKEPALAKPERSACPPPLLIHSPASSSGTNRIKDPDFTRPRVIGGAQAEMKSARRKTISLVGRY
eukprot:scaffold149113_cov36-Prasinocladus_malaysianus.AAC.1